MLKFLTHKLRTHSLNEDNVSEKEEGRDSGTESDEEPERAESDENPADLIMNWNDENSDINMTGDSCACVPVPRLLPEPESDLLYDHHSSEEELEVINGAPAASGNGARSAPDSRRRGASSPPAAAPEKRKWPASSSRSAGDDDDDDEPKVETPVRFRTSPPLEALKPRRCAANGSLPALLALPVAMSHASNEPSPRRRRAPPPAARRHRPALDFDKMQQLKVSGGVRSWRGVGGAGGELSVFCW